LIEVKGHCPACGKESLFLGDGGYVTCSRLECPRPDAVSTLLEDKETAHIVRLAGEGYTVRHPLIERLDDALMSCTVDLAIQGRGQPHPDDYGMYRMTPLGDLWAYERTDG
jgi:hypothetical protein